MRLRVFICVLVAQPGHKKNFFQPPEKLLAANEIAAEAQGITNKSLIYTVCNMQHAGGLLAQTMPAFSVGADFTVVDFNAYKWVREVNKYTHTHIAPQQAHAIMATKGFAALDLTGIWITCGSDIIDDEIIAAFLSKGAVFMCNWGMTEIGPIAINKTFRSLNEFEQIPQSGFSIIGDKAYCDYKIEEGELYVKGDISIYGNNWYATGDLVREADGLIWFAGRKQL